MKQLEVFNKIGSILKELNEQYQYIQSNPEVINDLEMELFVANAHFLTDHAEILNKLNQRTKAEYAEETRADKVGTKADTKALPPPARIEIPERKFELPAKPISQPKPEPVKAEEPAKPVEKLKPSSIVEKFFEPLVQKPKPKPTEAAEEESSSQIDLSSDTPKDSYSFIMEAPEVIRHELEIDPADMAGEEEEDEPVAVEAIEEVTPEPAKTEEPKPEVKDEPKPAVVEEPKAAEKQAEPVKDKEEVLTIHQRMSAQRGGASAYVEQTAQAVTNLKAAITLNDKLLFIKDLFNGYSLAYSEAIEILNRFNTFEEANRFLTKNYTVKNDWEGKPETAEKFYAILKRRYV